MGEAFDLGGAVPSDESSSLILVGLLILYLILIKCLGSKEFPDPTYLRKCSAGSWVEICEKAFPIKSYVNFCRVWHGLTTFLSAIVYLNISGIIIGKLQSVSVPSVYMNVLIPAFLLIYSLALSGKIVVAILLHKNRGRYLELKVCEIFS